MTIWLLTWFWQGLALTLVMSGTFRLLPQFNAATRYCIWWSGLGALGVLGAIGAWARTGASGATGATGAQLMSVADQSQLIVIPPLPDELFASVVGVWLAMALVLLVRLVPDVRAVFRLRDRCRDFPPAVEAELPLWLETKARRGRRQARLVLCDAVPGATVLGFSRPYIAVPTCLLTALTREELDQIALHEDAHVQRWDDWTRLAQALLQSALWIHPASAMIGRRLDLEREIACDEAVVATTGSPKVYARCLARAAEVRGRITFEALPGPALLMRRRDLVARVDRLLSVRGRFRGSVSLTKVLAGGCAVCVLALQLRAIPLVGERSVASRAAGQRLTPATESATADPSKIPPSSVAFGDLVPTAGGKRAAPASLPRESARQPEARVAAEAPIMAPAGLTSLELPIASVTPEPSLADSLTPTVVVGRSFEGRYVPANQAAASPEAAAPWEGAGAFGAEIGSSARKASVGVANTLTRAALSVARGF